MIIIMASILVHSPGSLMASALCVLASAKIHEHFSLRSDSSCIAAVATNDDDLHDHSGIEGRSLCFLLSANQGTHSPELPLALLSVSRFTFNFGDLYVFLLCNYSPLITKGSCIGFLFYILNMQGA